MVLGSCNLLLQPSPENLKTIRCSKLLLGFANFRMLFSTHANVTLHGIPGNTMNARIWHVITPMHASDMTCLCADMCIKTIDFG